MQSRLAATATRSCWVTSLRRRGLASASSGRTADPAIHSGEVEAGPGKGTEPFAPPRPPYASSPRLESTGINQPLDPIIQQKRSHATTSQEESSCAGLDGTPWPEDKEKEKTDREEEVEDDKEYYKHHKPSPLSEIKVADTRKPITRATDGTADSGEYGGGREVIGWRPEQLDTAEEALRRGVEIYRQNAMRGDPDTHPHSRILRELRGEWF